MSTKLCHAPSWFQTSRDNYANYPCNLNQTDLFEFVLQKYKEKLKDEDNDNFDKDDRNVRFWDIQENQDQYRLSSNIRDVYEMDQHLARREHDPLSSFLFIESAYSRSALGCSRDQLALVLTHHQVMVPFLDFVFTFRYRGDPETLATFKQEDSFHASNNSFAVPQLARSGFRYQHCFNLISVENDPSQDDWPWLIRQTAMYHSFDITEGRALWINLKGNSVIKERITIATETHSQLNPSALTSNGGKFVATLLIHSLLFEWCVESWPGYVDFLEQIVNQHSVQVHFTPVAELSAPEPIERGATSRRTTMSTFALPSRQGTFDTGSTSQHIFQAPKLLRQLSGRLSILDRKLPQKKLPTTASDHMDLDKIFSFKELQKLSSRTEDIQTAISIIDQDVKVVEEAVEHFSTILESLDFQRHIDISPYKQSIDNFFTKTNRLIRDMQNNKSRLQNLSISLNNVISKFYGVLQYKNMRTSEYFAQGAHDSARVMEHIAVKTRQETVSMHAITILTMVFLPGTFVAIFLYLVLLCIGVLTLAPSLQTFFGSGVLGWDDNAGGWSARREALVLFFSILVPLTVVTLGAWSVWYICSNRRGQRTLLRILDAESRGIEADEKNVGPSLP